MQEKYLVIQNYLETVSNNTRQQLPPLKLAWLMWATCGLLYLIGFFHRVSPAVMTNELMQDFAFGATELGSLSAFYFYSYVAMQVPTGFLADRWGARKLLSLGALIAAGGTLLFAQATDMTWASIGRLLIGASVGVAFVGMIKIASVWMAPGSLVWPQGWRFLSE